jgi:thymidine phosphorylase
MPAGERRVLTLRRLGIDTYQEAVIYMNRDCHVCRSEGFAAQSQVRVSHNGRQVIATLNTVASSLLADGEASLSENAWRALGAVEGARVEVGHMEPLESLAALRAKVYGNTVELSGWRGVVGDVVAGKYSDLHLAALVTACAGDRLSLAETVSLTRAMVEAGERLEWPVRPVADKHCVGGLPGNRTSPIVVAIVAAAGITIPKTSSRAITSPAGTADTMEVLAPVDLTVAGMRRVVEREGGCIVWGGNVGLSPADDVLIRVESPLDFDSEGQLVASVLSKKLAAGSTQVVVDMPVGPTAKVRSQEAAVELRSRLVAVAAELGLAADVVMTDGSQPVGRGIGPALEARDVLAVLQGARDAPADLRERSLLLAGRVLEAAGAAAPGAGFAAAAASLASGLARRKFEAICEAQGGMRTPPRAALTRVVAAAQSGVCAEIDNRRIARIAKLAGAPRQPAAGLDLHVRLGERIERGAPLYTLHADAPGELEYALAYAARQPDAIRVEEE